MITLVLEEEPLAIDISFDNENMVIELADGRSLAFPLEWYPRLFHGKREERQNWQLLGDGYAIEWLVWMNILAWRGFSRGGEVGRVRSQLRGGWVRDESTRGEVMLTIQFMKT